jgi:hypothetical protein
MRRAYESDEAGNMKVAQVGLWWVYIVAKGASVAIPPSLRYSVPAFPLVSLAHQDQKPVDQQHLRALPQDRPQRLLPCRVPQEGVSFESRR